MSTNTYQKSFSFFLMSFLFSLLVIFAPEFVQAQNKANYQINGNYTAEQKSLVVKALSLAVNRMQDEKIRKALKSKGGLYYLSGSVISNSNITDTEKDRKNLLSHQLYWLSQPNGANDSDPAFPDITINMVNEPSGSWVGRAYLDKVQIYWNSTLKEWQQKGEFNIKLNSAYVGKGNKHSVYATTDYWAGTIAHEMVHNLGHTHGTYGSDPNYHSYQVNVFDRLVTGNGYESSALMSSGSQMLFGCDVK